MDVVAKHPELYGYDSPLTEANKVRCPILIINGRNDTSSPVVVMEVYVDRLRAAGKAVETYFPDNAPHGFYFWTSQKATPDPKRRLRRLGVLQNLSASTLPEASRAKSIEPQALPLWRFPRETSRWFAFLPESELRRSQFSGGCR